jgi:uncharacterized spore protein YtfJ
MNVSEFLPRFAESFAARRVFAEPVEKDGTTIIPAAAVRGGGGMGQGANERDGGAGMGLAARPVGAYVLKNGGVVWKPAFDISRVILGGQIVAITAMVVGGIVMSRRRH